ncbi:MAG TPA: MATE family efflux transporter [Treponemataceae bacterium]|nr:MATE family efflux transporter [Treponemataceae bacterium]
MKDLTRGNETWLLISFSIPMLFGNLFQQLYNMVDSIVVGNWVGKEALAAVGASFPVIFLLLSLFMGLSMGANILISQYHGARDTEKVKLAIETNYLFTFWAGLVLMAVGFFGAEPIMRILQSPPEVLPQASLYLKIYSLGMLPFLGFNTVSGVLRGLGDAKNPLWMLLISTLLNIVLDLLFVIAFGWGVAGVAVATIISQGLALALALIYLNRTHELLRVDFRKLRFNREIFLASVRIGVPSGIQQSLVALGISTMTGIVNSFGTDAIAGYAAATRIESIASLPAMTISMALSTFVGQNLGAGQGHRVRRGLKSALIFSISISILAALLFHFAGSFLVGLFNTDPGVLEAGSSYLRIIGPFFVVFSVLFMLNGVIRGAGESVLPLVSTLIAMWIVRVPAAFAFSKLIGLNGVWWALPTGWIVGATVTFVYYRSGRWMKTFDRIHSRGTSVKQ